MANLKPFTRFFQVMCPLKQAAKEAPNSIALIFQSAPISFQMLDNLVEKQKSASYKKEKNSLSLIIQILANIRQKRSLFLINPNLPKHEIFDLKIPPSLLLYTSGSTRTPKIAILPFDALLENAKSASLALDLKEGDQWMLSLPLYHVGGIGILLRCILAKATIVLDKSIDITHLSYVPTQLYRATPIYPKLRMLLLGGAPIYKTPKNLPIHTTYGLTEMGSMVTLDGKVLDNREVKIASDGEILVKGPTLFYGYANEKPIEGWFHTKDLGHFEDGRLIIDGRKDWMFISGGENIQPEEIEAALLEISQVHQAVVLGIDDLEFGKICVAVVIADQPFDFPLMKQLLLPKLPRYKIPKELFIIQEMPIKQNFKLDRFILTQIIKNKRDMTISGQKKTAYL